MKIKDKKWHDLVANFSGQPFDPDIRSYKDSLFNKDMVEKYLLMPTQFIYVYDLVDVEMTYVSPQIKAILGYEPESFKIEYLYDFVHPEDRERVFTMGKRAVDYGFQNLDEVFIDSVSVEYRVKRLDSKYIKVLRQSTAITVDKLGNPVHALSLITDLIHKNQDTKSIRYIYDNNEKVESNLSLSSRELDILKLLSDGKSSKEIAKILFICKDTVDKHRKNMLHKNSMKNTSELITLAKENSLI
ncbi:MAG: hypothetical protein HW421_1956 [Ignavibacteria bacterium]|nr:hypothetical protein [Ignavibacteria bacterium]